MDKNNTIQETPSGCLFADPRMIDGEYIPAKHVHFANAIEYAKKVKAEEGRDVTIEEMQQFAVR